MIVEMAMHVANAAGIFETLPISWTLCEPSVPISTPDEPDQIDISSVWSVGTRKPWFNPAAMCRDSCDATFVDALELRQPTTNHGWHSRYCQICRRCRGLELPHVLRTKVQRTSSVLVYRSSRWAHVRPSAKGVHYADCCASAVCFVVEHMQLEMRWSRRTNRIGCRYRDQFNPRRDNGLHFESTTPLHPMASLRVYHHDVHLRLRWHHSLQPSPLL